MIVRLNGSSLQQVILLLFLALGFVPVLFAQGNSLEYILGEAARHLGRRDFSSAIELFDRLNQEDAESIDILILRGSIYNSAGRPADAKGIANKIITVEPENSSAFMILADAAALEGKDRERRTYLEQVIMIEPGHSRALNDLGNINLANRNLRVAAGYFDRVLAVEQSNGEALVSRAVIHRFNNEPKSAEQLLDRAANLYPEWARPLHERGRLYRSAGYLSDALEDMDSARKLEPDNYWIILDRGLVLLDMNRRVEAMEEFTRAISIDQNNFLAYVYTAGLRMESGDYTGAEQDFARLARLNPGYYFAFEGLGMLRMKDKRWAEARDAFLEAYKHAPREYSYALLSAINWMRAGRITDPKQFLAQVLRTAETGTIEHSMLRLFHDLSGDLDVAVRVENEKNHHKKAQMLFYLASYYDIRGNTNLANRYYVMVQELGTAGSVEWQLNEWVLAERGLGLRVGQ